MSKFPSLSRVVLASASVVVLGGCVAAGDIRPFADMAPVTPVMPVAPAPTAGAIYAAGPGLNLYGDRRARDVGDLLTINLVESTTASTTARTNISKESDLNIGSPSLFGAPVTLGGKDILSASGSADRDFSGQGNSAQSNKLVGQITVTVIQRLPNGNLVVQGEKNLRLNQGNELVQVQGIVRPADVSPDNTISSSKVADARIAYGGRGPVAQSNAMSWLGRFFNSAFAPL